MTILQVKTEIQRVLDEMPADTLPEVLDFLKAIQVKPGEDITLDKFLTQTFIEDKELLMKLAK